MAKGNERPEPLELRILMIEDSDTDAAFAQGLLKRFAPVGTRIVREATLERGIAAASQTAFDVVLLDLSLPGTYGLDTLQRFLVSRPGTPIVVLTGLDDESIGTLAVRSGAQDYLVKGRIDGASLWRTIRFSLERQRLRTLLAVRQAELERRNRQLDEFAHLLSHDLKAPLRAIGNYAKWIKEELDRGDFPAVESLLERLEASSKRASLMVDTMLAQAVGQSRLQVESLEFETVAREAVESLGLPPGFEVELVAHSPTIAANRSQLLRILQNLVGNAIKHHDRGEGRVQVACAELTNDWEITVEDDGPGVDSQVQERLFAKYGTGPVGPGAESTGLGLYSVHQIVMAQGGTIEYTPRSPRGSRFRVLLPRGIAPTSPPPSGPSLTNPRI